MQTKLLQITAFSVLNRRIIWKDDIEFVTEFPCFLGHPVSLYVDLVNPKYNFCCKLLIHRERWFYIIVILGFVLNNHVFYCAIYNDFLKNFLWLTMWNLKVTSNVLIYFIVRACFLLMTTSWGSLENTSLYTLHSTLYTLHSALNTQHSTLNTQHSTPLLR